MANYKNAKSGDQNVKIRAKYYNYNTKRIDWVRDDDYDIRTWATYDAAAKWVKEIENTEYYLKNGEYGRPDYRIVLA